MTKRKQFLNEGRVVYEWDESLDSVYLFIESPLLAPTVRIQKFIEVKFSASKLRVGIVGNPPYLEHELAGVADSEECTWFVQDSPQDKAKKEIAIQIAKAQKAIQWGCVFKGHNVLNPLEQEELRKKIMLERFQEEHPGFDFSAAEFNGRVPEARTFMGGMTS